ncbi:MAG: hypothetical protein DIU76_10645 [Bacillota bacterium]|nr:MAG: hypothetical protein DIU76_10645 [Bacillota bacterium]
MVQGETGTGGDCWCRIASTVLEVLLTQALWFGVRIGWPARRLPRRSAGARPRRWGLSRGRRERRARDRAAVRHRRMTA